MESVLFVLWHVVICRVWAWSGQNHERDNAFAFFCADTYYVDADADWPWTAEHVYDTANLLIWYRMYFWDQNHAERLRDFRTVYVGKNGYRKDCSWAVEELERRLQEDSVDRADILADKSYLSVGHFYPMDWVMQPDGKYTCLFRLAFLDVPMVIEYEEPAAKFAWELLPETDSVGGYLCQKAETEYKGRNYEAWFCPEIPIDAGPYKFRGLPGLILKVEDKAGDYSWTFIDGAIQNLNEPMIERDYIRRKASRSKARRLIQGIFEKPFPYAVSMGANILIYQEDGNHRPLTGEEMEESIYYTPIELE